MNRNLITILGLLTFVPAICLCYSCWQLLEVVYGHAGRAQSVSAVDLSRDISTAIQPAVLAAFVAFPLVVFYVWHAWSRIRWRSSWVRVVWVLALILFAPFSMLVYGYAHVWSEQAMGSSVSS